VAVRAGTPRPSENTHPYGKGAPNACRALPAAKRGESGRRGAKKGALIYFNEYCLRVYKISRRKYMTNKLKKFQKNKRQK